MIEVSRQGRVALITLARPEKHNALNLDLCRGLYKSIGDVQDARAVVLTGRGRSFCSGADLNEVYASEFRGALYSMLNRIATLRIPVIASVGGAAIGAGTQLAIAADFRVVTLDARFSLPTARLGLAVDPWTIRRLALLAGANVARRMLLGCAELSAETAISCGLADRGGTLSDALAWASELSEFAPLTISYSKRALNAVFEPELDPQLAAELNAAFEGCWASEDLSEGRRSRVENRMPQFEGR